MQSKNSPWFIEGQSADSRTGERSVSVQSSDTNTKVNEFAKEAHAKIIFETFINAVERLERLLDKETVMLIEHRSISLDEFNHKKRHGLLELSRAIDALRGLDRDCLVYDPKASVARLRVKLQNNLKMLQTHLDAVRAIAAIIARAIHEQESDGTYTQDLNIGRSR